MNMIDCGGWNNRIRWLRDNLKNTENMLCIFFYNDGIKFILYINATASDVSLAADGANFHHLLAF